MSMNLPVYVLVHPDGRAYWGDNKENAEAQLGPHGVGRTFLGGKHGDRLRLAMSDCAAILPDIYPPNPYAARFLAEVAGYPVEAGPEVRGSVVLFGFDPMNEWDSSRIFTAEERREIEEALKVAGCSDEGARL